MKYIKKPVVVDAIRWTGDNWDDIEKFSPYGIKFNYPSRLKSLTIDTLEGHVTAECGDWIIKGIEGEIYPCKDSVFQKTYDPYFVSQI